MMVQDVKMDLSRRRRQPEIMDEVGLQPERNRLALRGLERINKISTSAASVFHMLRPMLNKCGAQSYSLLDIASGAGDLPISLSHRAQRCGIDLKTYGCDKSKFAVEYARQNARSYGADVAFFVHDILNEELVEQYDFVTSSLFLHHLDEPDAVCLLRKMARLARRAIIINDLRRGAYGYWLAWVGTRILTRSDVVHFDGPLSVESAFTLQEMRQLAAAAGQVGGTLRPSWPARFLYCWTPV